MPSKAEIERIRRETPQLADFLEYVAELNRESDRGAVLVAATRIDQLLAEAIVARLVDHPDTVRLVEGFNAPLGTFSARILAGFALGILSDNEYRDCETIRKIRNEFAHKLGVSFTDQRIVDLCNNLYSAFRHKDVADDTRSAFTSAAFVMAAFLTRRAEHVGKERLTYRMWGFTNVTDGL